MGATPLSHLICTLCQVLLLMILQGPPALGNWHLYGSHCLCCTQEFFRLEASSVSPAPHPCPQDGAGYPSKGTIVQMCTSYEE